jgi:hypothetical protein
MANEVFNELARMIAYRDGTTLYPKGDGRVEIPHGIVRLMGWRDKSTVWIKYGPGCLVLSGNKPDNPIGRITVSMERARIPMSMLKAASMGNSSVVATLNLSDGSMVVRRSLASMADICDLEGAFREAGEPVCRRLMAILGGAQQDKIPDKSETVPDIPAPLSKNDAKKPWLFLMNTKKPMIIRVIGTPFAFQAHWVTNSSVGELVPHIEGCPLCEFRAPERMSLIPVIRKSDGQSAPGFLLAQEDLRSKIARQLVGRNPTDFDLVLYFAPFQDGLCSVYKAPPEPIGDDLVKTAQAVCSDPNGFVASSFGTTLPDAKPTRAPMFIVEGHFSEEHKPHNLVK